MKLTYLRLVFPVSLFVCSLMFLLLPWAVVEVQVTINEHASTETFYFPLWERLATNACYRLIVKNGDQTAGQAISALQWLGWIALLVQVLLWVVFLYFHRSLMVRLYQRVGAVLVLVVLGALAWALFGIATKSSGFECIFMAKATAERISLFWPSGLIVLGTLALTLGGIVLRPTNTLPGEHAEVS